MPDSCWTRLSVLPVRPVHSHHRLVLWSQHIFLLGLPGHSAASCLVAFRSGRRLSICSALLTSADVRFRFPAALPASFFPRVLRKLPRSGDLSVAIPITLVTALSVFCFLRWQLAATGGHVLSA